MISTSNVSLRFGGKKLFDEVNVKFTPGNCYGLIGANGCGKSTYMKVLAGVLTPSAGNISIDSHERMAFLKQDQFAYEDQRVLDVVLSTVEAIFAQGAGGDVVPLTELLRAASGAELMVRACGTQDGGTEGCPGQEGCGTEGRRVEGC